MKIKITENRKNKEIEGMISEILDEIIEIKHLLFENGSEDSDCLGCEYCGEGEEEHEFDAEPVILSWDGGNIGFNDFLGRIINATSSVMDKSKDKEEPEGEKESEKPADEDEPERVSDTVNAVRMTVTKEIKKALEELNSFGLFEVLARANAVRKDDKYRIK